MSTGLRLFCSSTSPYSRKVRLLIIEQGLQDQVEIVFVNPFEDNPELIALNPLGKIPTLLLENGETLFDSPLVCRYLDSLSPQSTLLAGAGWLHWQRQRWEALANGVVDESYNLVMERRRPTDQHSAEWIARWSSAIHSALAVMEARVGELKGEVTLAQLTVASALGYLDFRLPEALSAAECPQLLAWYERFKTRPSMLLTQPTD
ncbi:MAG: glutathione S-transferase N-terminal domain-containing protein [Gammaproteobacteria bacterium]|nr:glutathione S-transferase N-terminal domain-containing protein [Gammaproteobacteria bacterium]